MFQGFHLEDDFVTWNTLDGKSVATEESKEEYRSSIPRCFTARKKTLTLLSDHINCCVEPISFSKLPDPRQQVHGGIKELISRLHPCGEFPPERIRFKC